MKIGFDAKRLFFNGSGLGNYSRSTAGLLMKYAPQNKYAFFTPKEGNRYGFVVPDGAGVVTPQGIKTISGSLWRSYGMSTALKISGVDIYHGLSNELPADIGRSGVRSVVTMHDIIFVHHPELYKPADRWLYKRKYSRSCRNADLVIAISRQTAGDLVNYWNIPREKIRIVYQGCDPVFEKPATEKQKREAAMRFALPERYILSVGTIEERKNLMLTVIAMAESGLDIDLVACGRHTRYADRVMEYAAQHGLGSRVKFLHSVPSEFLPAIYQMASAFVYPSFYEGFGIPILEAMNSKVPVITTRGGVFAETGGDACLYVDPMSPEEMAEALRRVLEDSDLSSRMTERGTAHAKGFRESVIADNLMAVYKELFP